MMIYLKLTNHIFLKKIKNKNHHTYHFLNPKATCFSNLGKYFKNTG